MTELQQTNLEKTLLVWCRQIVQVTIFIIHIIYKNHRTHF
jgi:hypothetical protein